MKTITKTIVVSLSAPAWRKLERERVDKEIFKKDFYGNIIEKASGYKRQFKEIKKTKESKKTNDFRSWGGRGYE